MIGNDPSEYGFQEDGHPVPAEQFDYDLVEQNLFGRPDDRVDLSRCSQADVDAAITVLRVMLCWIWQNGMKNADGLKIRAIVICWIFLKELRPLTLTQMAVGFGMKKQSLGRWVDQFKAAFKIRTAHMRNLDE